MADDFKQGMNNKCGPGGLHCSCCNDFTGKDKAKLDRLVRRTQKLKINKELPDGKELCDDCGLEFDKAEIIKDTNLRTGVVGQYCKFCMELHESNE